MVLLGVGGKLVGVNVGVVGNIGVKEIGGLCKVSFDVLYFCICMVVV